ncbi:MAG: hypothetical protein Q4C91_19290 [Eubacteriales bacterium]|nr:hypothetical protein [Eubacteriales bacterium]
MLQETEKLIKENRKSAVFEVMLPDLEEFEKRGYHTLRHEKMILLNDNVLIWTIMEKEL